MLHVLASNDRRGAEVFAIDLATALEQLGWESTVVSLTRSTSTATVPAEPLGAGRWWRSLGPLRQQAKTHDVVIAHGSTALPACAIACAGITPFVYRSIGDPAYWSSSGLKRRQTTLLLNRADTVVALFPSAANTLRTRGVTSEIATIPNAVDAAAFPMIDEFGRRTARAELGLPSDASVVLFLGALSLEKRPERALTLARARPELHVVVVGDGPMRDQLGDEAAGLANVSVLGPTSTPHQALAAADVLIVPSDTEGVPAVAIEAGLSGLPVVASDVGGLASVIEQGETGWLVTPGDDDELMAAADKAIVAGQSVGLAARRRCLERFDIGPVAVQWAGVITRSARIARLRE